MTPLVLYDANCPLCIAIVSKFKSKTTDSSLVFIALQDKSARRILKERGEQFICMQTIYFITKNKEYKFSTAIFKILELMPYPIKLWCVFNILPISISDWLYKKVAMFRYKLISK